MPVHDKKKLKLNAGFYIKKAFHKLDSQFSNDDDKSLSEVLAKFYEVFHLPTEDLEARKNLCESIQELLKPYFPNCQLRLIGSSVTGFAVIDCMQDFLFLPAPTFFSKIPTTSILTKWKPNKKKPSDQSMEIDEPKIEEVKSGDFDPSRLLELDEQKILLFIRNVLIEQKGKFKIKPLTEYSIKTNPHIDNITFTAIELRMRCLITLKNRLALCNSELMELYGKLDKRVKPLMLAICCWGKCTKVSLPLVLGTFAIQLLVVFLLQNTSPAILPTVSHLHKMSKSSEVMDGYEISFQKDPFKIPKTRNTQSLGELFVQFFEFYYNFDFSRNLISTHIGKSYALKDMRKSSIFADFQVAPICIQDPFQLKCNVSVNIDNFQHSRFKQMLCTTLSILKKLPEPTMSLEDFKNIFKMEYYSNIVGRQMLKFYKKYHFISIFNLDFNTIQRLGDSKNVTDVWYERAPAAILDLLKHGLLIDCEITNQITYLRQESYKKGSKPVFVRELDQSEFSQDPVIPLQLLLEAQCKVDYHCITERQVIPTTSFPESTDFCNAILKKEHEISRFIIQQNPKRWKANPQMIFNLQMFASKLPQFPELFLIFIPLTEAKGIESACQLIHSYLLRYVPQVI